FSILFQLLVILAGQFQFFSVATEFFCAYQLGVEVCFLQSIYLNLLPFFAFENMPVQMCVCELLYISAMFKIIIKYFFYFSYSRSFIFPFLIRGGKSTPFFVFVSAFIFCSYNGYLQGRSLSNYAEYSSNWLTEPRFILAWLGGLLINMHSDYILRNLRKPGETEYKIPRGGMFEYVNGANFFGEIIEWCGFALACNTVESTAFAITTLLLLGSRAYWHHHKEYSGLIPSKLLKR
uniref:Steroid 5 alpha-reductase 1 n=1 Tax=Laticauda laticaudata TaxID=8630 RepID=A0A8C5SDP8_LATLA